MACLTWELPNGERYTVAEGVAHSPKMGAKMIGVQWNCGPSTATDAEELERKLEGSGVQWGSAIKWVTSKIGIKQCSKCKAREVILNHAKELGWGETIRQLKETI